MPKIIVAHEDLSVRAGLESYLAQTPFEIVGSFPTSQEALAAMNRTPADVIIADIFHGREKESFELLDIATKRKMKSVVFATSMNPTHVALAAASGASDYFPQGMSKGDFVESLGNVVAGKKNKGSLLDRTVALLSDRTTFTGDDCSTLTPRECQIVRNVAVGLPNKAIANLLEISVETVKEHVQHVLRKLGFNDRTMIVAWYAKKYGAIKVA